LVSTHLSTRPNQKIDGEIQKG
jgi:hypothetical protein